MKTYEEFLDSLKNETPPKELSTQLLALWYDANGNWDKAHSYVDGPTDPSSHWIHAYLHRKEGDLSNADYWYKKADKSRPGISLDEEWTLITKKMIAVSI
ncbi:hypothetical protein A33Q_1201 [Indibacter alkaliphilus LW1]|uniref:Uncharacterized protein n=1 Tax=Indibacter alkaliphilus (strain CCUG 57479 / KCTC 22604 / LW1) TaxID=1189612 RepID=S2DHR7_INDAL|nr:hypothetical protein [Indibacter alkaliphilus]EOZ98547.1 hypothetical protein A33Q_1201 [Indibacter alkaliphilus LW1]